MNKFTQIQITKKNDTTSSLINYQVLLLLQQKHQTVFANLDLAFELGEVYCDTRQKIRNIDRLHLSLQTL